MARFDIQVKALTPLAIGGGQQPLSPYSDYYVKGQQVHYINQDKLTNALLKDRQVLDTFMQRIKTTDSNNLPNLDLSDFIEHQLQINHSELIDWSLETNLDDADRLPVNQIIKTANRLYIPGSSIKGAIKTALLYDWVANRPDIVIDEWIKEISDCYQAIQQQLAEWNIEFLNENPNRKRLKYLEGQMVKPIKDLSNWFRDNISNQTFEEGYSKAFNHLQITDTPASGNLSDMMVIKTSRYHLFGAGEGIPIATEAIKPGYSTSFKLIVEPHHKKTAFPKLTNGTEVMRVLQQFTNAALTTEKVLLDHATIIDHNRELYERLKDVYESFFDKTEDSNSVKLRLGSGKSIIWNTILPALHERNPEAFHQLRKIYRIGHRHSDAFPSSMVLTNPGYQQLGWIEFNLTK